jgi:hypothetical protein
VETGSYLLLIPIDSAWKSIPVTANSSLATIDSSMWRQFMCSMLECKVNLN